MEVRHGGLILDVPEGWADQSTLLFVAPPDVQAQSAPTANKSVQATEVVSVRFMFGQHDEARAALKGETEAMAAADAQFAVISEGPFTCGLGEGWRIVQRVHVGGIALRQISCAVVVGAVTVLASATAGDARFEKMQAQLDQVLTSMRSAHRG
jgi:hypothetical protein